MGFYVNPSNGTKEDWLRKHGKRIGILDFINHIPAENGFVGVCLVDNGWMTAAGVAFCTREAEAFADRNDHRPKEFYLVQTKHLLHHKGMPDFDYVSLIKEINQ